VYVNSDCEKMHGDYRIKFIWMLSSHPCLGLSKGLVLFQGFQQSCMYFLHLQCVLHAPVIHPPWFDAPKILQEEYNLWRSSLCSSFPTSCQFLPFTSKHSPQHTVLKHPQLTFFPQHVRQSFISIQNKKYTYISVF
jgi:hypothetical protein